MQKIASVMILCAFLVTSLFSQDTQDTEISEKMAPTPIFEIGALLGEPIGLSMKFWHGTMTATDIAAAWSFQENGAFEMHIDFLLHPINLRIITGGGNFPLYTGAGFAARVGDQWFLGVRLPIGMEYIMTTLPLTFFGEVAPQWQFSPDNEFVLSGGAGVRLKFGSIK